MAEKALEKKKETRPKVRSRSNICEEQGSIILRLEMPGVKKDGVDISVDNNQLTVTGTREIPEAEGKYLMQERRLGDFYQAYTIDDTIDREKIEAELTNGLLTVTLHIKEAEKPKKITVKAG